MKKTTETNKKDYKMKYQGCDQCQVLRINGLASHESGCSNSHLDPATNEFYELKCFECGFNFVPEIRYYSTSAAICNDCLDHV